MEWGGGTTLRHHRRHRAPPPSRQVSLSRERIYTHAGGGTIVTRKHRLAPRQRSRTAGVDASETEKWVPSAADDGHAVRSRVGTERTRREGPGGLHSSTHHPGLVYLLCREYASYYRRRRNFEIGRVRIKAGGDRRSHLAAGARCVHGERRGGGCGRRAAMTHTLAAGPEMVLRPGGETRRLSLGARAARMTRKRRRAAAAAVYPRNGTLHTQIGQLYAVRLSSRPPPRVSRSFRIARDLLSSRDKSSDDFFSRD